MSDNTSISLIDDNNSTFYAHEGREVHVYQGPSPPSYWDSPISASQLIVTIILLVILCVIYTCSNLEKDDEKFTIPCTCPKNETKPKPLNVKTVPTEGHQNTPLATPGPGSRPIIEGDDNINVILELDTRLRQLEASNLSDNLHEELIAMRGRLDKVSDWLKTCRPPEPDPDQYPGKMTEV